MEFDHQKDFRLVKCMLLLPNILSVCNSEHFLLKVSQ